MLASARVRLGEARLQLLFTPALVPAGRDPLEVLAQALPWIDIVQVRIKPAGAAQTPAPARASLEWAERVLELFHGFEGDPPLLIIDDRVDVAAALADCAGVHLGQDDCPPTEARRLLGEDACIGLSTHDARQVAAAQTQPVDYLGFGPVFATPTKGYERGLGAEAAWVAAQASSLPLFPIGGVDATRADELSQVGRAVVGSAILAADDPAAAARELRCLLS